MNEDALKELLAETQAEAAEPTLADTLSQLDDTVKLQREMMRMGLAGQIASHLIDAYDRSSSTDADAIDRAVKITDLLIQKLEETKN